jgi:RNA recognition motif-containing protein
MRRSSLKVRPHLPSAVHVFLVVLFAVMKQTLRGLFKSYGEVLDVVAHNNLRMRGQAFVSFADAEVAKKALRDVQRFPLYSKPMVRFSLAAYVYEIESHSL